MNPIRCIKDKIYQNTLDSLQQIMLQIDHYDVISFDLFDTLLKRNVNQPIDVFKYIEKKCNIPGFCSERILAERRARERKGNLEITLEEIYNLMPYDFLEEELLAESKLLIGNDLILPIFKKAVLTKEVILTSDMYLPENFIKTILERENIYNYKKLYLSSTIGKTKRSGELFDLILDRYGKDKKILHIGDSYKSDYCIPRKKGIDSVHIPNKVVKSGFRLKGKDIEENIINSFLNNTVPLQNNKYYLFGYEKFGVFLWGYSKWLHDSIKKEDIKDIYFFSRDGLIMKKAFDILYTDMETHYLEVSRRSLRVPILWLNCKLDHVINMISPSKQISMSMLFDGVGLDIDEYSFLLNKYGYDEKTVFNRKDILQTKELNDLYDELKDDIIKNSKKEYKLLVNYIKQNISNHNFAVVDIGWSGGMQRYLLETLNRLGIDANIKGYYIGVADYYKRNVKVMPNLDLNGYLFDFYHNKKEIDKRSSFVGLFETFFLEQDGSVKNYQDDKGIIKSNRLPYEYFKNGEPTNEYKCVTEIQRGAIDFIRRFGVFDINISPDILFEGINQTGSNPNKKDLTMFSDFRFFDEGETHYLARPRSLLFYFFHLKSLKRDFLSSRWKIGFMKKLFKVPFPYQYIYCKLQKYK